MRFKEFTNIDSLRHAKVDEKPVKFFNGDYKELNIAPPPKNSSKETKAEIQSIKEFMSNQINYARENGYVKTIFGRKRFLSDINSRNGMIRSSAERNAINTPVQGSAADIIKLSMIKIANEFNIISHKYPKIFVNCQDPTSY